MVSYGRFFTADVQQAGGFLPIVWDVPGTDMEAADAVSVVAKYLRTLFTSWHADGFTRMMLP